MKYSLILVGVLGCYQVAAKAVFAHFMVGNTGDYTPDDWRDDITKAQAAHIDAFVLNIAQSDANNSRTIPMAFAAAKATGFKMFFSFDYAGGGAWGADNVTALLKQYGPTSEYYKVNGKPFASTFEGPANASDWRAIKADTGCFFIPDWSSKGASGAMKIGEGIIDGLFNWGSWPEGPNDMNNVVDSSYWFYLKGLPYMMPASPWFYTNMPGFRKNWLWRGDSLWFDRWNQIFYLQPPFVQIISWNDYGESHYIGPLRPKAFGSFGPRDGRSPFNYAANMPHDAWRKFLPYLIDTYKNNVSSVVTEGVVSWYRLTSTSACGSGGTTGNTATQLQTVYDPALVAQDKVFFSALLGSAATVSVQIGSVVQNPTWEDVPSGGIGVYHGSVPMKGATGTVTVTVTRSGARVAQMVGQAINGTCANGIQNYNAWVGGADGPTLSPAKTPTLTLKTSVCIQGFGVGNYLGLCQMTCQYGYCPSGQCTCTKLGAQVALPKPSAPAGTHGCPAPGMDVTYKGLCDFTCAYGYCPSGACTLYPTSHVCVAPEASAPPIPACVRGTGEGNFGGLCSFSCGYGFCPGDICTCTQAGSPVPAPATTDVVGSYIDPKVNDGGLCAWTCAHGYCPDTACSSPCAAGTGPGNFAGLCSFSCSYGFCPSEICSCTRRGGTAVVPDIVDADGTYIDPAVKDYGLCQFTCSHGYCPDTACVAPSAPVIDFMDVRPHMFFETKGQNVTIESRLTNYGGCNEKQQKEIVQAFADALSLAGAVGHGFDVLGHNYNDDDWEPSQAAIDFYGPANTWSGDEVHHVAGNWDRAQLPLKQNRFADWWYDRYFNITCNDPAKAAGLREDPPQFRWGCGGGVGAYTLNREGKSMPWYQGKYPLINFCYEGRTNFSRQDEFQAVAKKTKNGDLPQDTVDYLGRTKGGIFLHEMFHTESKNLDGGQDAGVASPACVDIILTVNGQRTKAYGAPKAKYLARKKNLPAFSTAFYNNDNYLYYAVSQYMMKKLNIKKYPSEPAASWNGATPDENNPAITDSIDENSGFPAVVDDGVLYSDEEFYKSYVLVVRVMFVQFKQFSAWYWFSSGKTLDTCAASPDTVITGGSGVTFDNPGFPGPNDGDGVIDGTEEHGYRNCVYSFDAGKPGTVKCDNEDAFPCVEDKSPVIDCPAGGPSKLSERSYKPRVILTNW